MARNTLPRRKLTDKYLTKQAWYAMIYRCTRPNHQAYRNYGGRGIKVCKRWLHSFDNFLADVGVRPSPELTLDRIDNDGDYEPENVRWATRKVQGTNRRTCRRISFEGRMLSVSEFAKALGCTCNAIYFALKRGRTVEQIAAYHRNPLKPRLGERRCGPRLRIIGFRVVQTTDEYLRARRSAGVNIASLIDTAITSTDDFIRWSTERTS